MIVSPLRLAAFRSETEGGLRFSDRNCLLCVLSFRSSARIGMSLIEFETEDRRSNPVDTIEHIAAINDWSFERSADDEITIAIGGGWCDYHVSFSWMEDRWSGCTWPARSISR